LNGRQGNFRFEQEARKKSLILTARDLIKGKITYGKRKREKMFLLRRIDGG
jgi:hypothetical protein